MSVSINFANPSELDLLRQRITELETENFNLKNENQKLKKKLESRIKDHEIRLAKVKQVSSVEQPDDVKLEQDSLVVNKQSQDAEDEKVFLLRGEYAKGASSKKEANGNQSNNANTKSTEDDSMDAFLIK